MRGDWTVGSAELPADIGLGNSARSPSAIEMLEPSSGKSHLGLITEN
jgi:hypothetical protein